MREINGTLNILAVPGSPSVAELKDLGGVRVSLGSGPSRVAAGALRSLARELREQGTYGALGTTAIPYADVQDLLARRK